MSASAAGGRHLDRPEVRFRVGRRIQVRGEEPFLVDLDGECFAARDARFEVVPAALRVVVGDEPGPDGGAS